MNRQEGTPQACRSAAAAPLELSPDEFRALGYRVVDRIAEFLKALPQMPVSRDESAKELRQLIARPFPEHGEPAGQLLEQAMDLLLEHSTFNAHPRFWGYITGAPAPLGALGDLIASALNPNLGKWVLSPIGTEIEAQAVRWMAELVGYPADCGGLFVSGGSMANLVGLLAARKSKANWDVRSEGLTVPEAAKLRIYASRETHIWLQKSADLAGFGSGSIRWIPSDDEFRMDAAALRKAIDEDTKKGDVPFLVLGNAGTVSTGAVDPLPEQAAICREHGLWFHVDGAYGGLGSMLPEAGADLRGLALADSVAIDPHKWMHAPLEAGCILVRDAQLLHDTFFASPQYYHLVEDEADKTINYFEWGPQNARGFRALKVWLCLRQAGREGYQRMIRENIGLSQLLYKLAAAHPQLEALTQSLSITTFRYVPSDLRNRADAEEYLNRLNREVLTGIQRSGEAFISNAVIRGKFALRACIVNFRTRDEDIEALPQLVARIGAEMDAKLR